MNDRMVAVFVRIRMGEPGKTYLGKWRYEGYIRPNEIDRTRKIVEEENGLGSFFYVELPGD